MADFSPRKTARLTLFSKRNPLGKANVYRGFDAIYLKSIPIAPVSGVAFWQHEKTLRRQQKTEKISVFVLHRNERTLKQETAPTAPDLVNVFDFRDKAFNNGLLSFIKKHFVLFKKIFAMRINRNNQRAELLYTHDPHRFGHP